MDGHMGIYVCVNILVNMTVKHHLRCIVPQMGDLSLLLTAIPCY